MHLHLLWVREEAKSQGRTKQWGGRHTGGPLCWKTVRLNSKHNGNMGGGEVKDRSLVSNCHAELKALEDVKLQSVRLGEYLPVGMGD